MALAIIATSLVVYQAARLSLEEVLRLTLLLLAVLLPLGAWYVHIFLRPLIELRKRAAGFTEKFAGTTVEVYHGNEIKRLLYTFSAMVSALEDHEEKCHKAEALLQLQNATLETRLKELVLELEHTKDLLLHETSEHTLAQEKAVELQQLLSSLIDSLPSLLIGIDQQGRINQWNLEAQKSCGLTFAQVSGRPLHETLPCLASLREKIDQTLSQESQNKISHFVWPTNNGNKLTDITINPVLSKHRGGAVILIDDVTERIRLNQLIVQTEKMMSIGGLAAGMAHEINNPLASIIQNTQVITQRLSPALEKNRSCAEMVGSNIETLNAYLNERQIPKMLVSILESGQRVGEIVGHMLTFARENQLAQANQNVAELFDVSELLDLAVDMATKDYDLKKKHNILQIGINRNYAAKLPKILCTPGQLKQVFFNLIENSAQAMSAWTDMPNPPRLDLTIQRKEQMLSIEISDNGPGIDLENQKRIFEPFFSTKDIGLGSGLGLSVSYFIITENHQGQLSVTSARGKGTCFHILLPL